MRERSSVSWGGTELERVPSSRAPLVSTLPGQARSFSKRETSLLSPRGRKSSLDSDIPRRIQESLRNSPSKKTSIFQPGSLAGEKKGKGSVLKKSLPSF